MFRFFAEFEKKKCFAKHFGSFSRLFHGDMKFITSLQLIKSSVNTSSNSMN